MNSNKNSSLLTSYRQDWKTPRALYQALDAEFHFDFDPCPAGASFDGLEVGWGLRNFINPPFNNIKKWVHRAHSMWITRQALVVLLIPVRSDTIWWHEFILQADEIRFIKGRLRFDDGKGRATFPSAIIIFKPRPGDHDAKKPKD